MPLLQNSYKMLTMSDRSERICVVGLGYIGLPTASILAASGFHVVGCDVDEEKIEVLKRRELPIYEPGLRTIFEGAIGADKLSFSTSPPREADAYILCVPTPVSPDGSPNLSYLREAARAVAGVLEKGNLVVVESTIYPGATEEVLFPLLQEQGLEPGKDVFVAHCPERVIPGHIIKELIENDRVIGGYTPECARQAEKIYRSFVEGKIFITDLKTAEMVKLAENTYRMVNIALAMEFALIAEHLGINVWEVITLANRHPRVDILNPGPGMGGHCLPVDPYFLLHVYKDARVTHNALQTNEIMLAHSTGLATSMLSPGEKATILGVAYKGNVDDARNSPGFALGKRLKEKGFEVSYHDPHVKAEGVTNELEKAIRHSHLLVVAADHNEYRLLKPGEVAPLMKARRILDLRRVIDAALWEAEGFEVRLLGASSLK